MIRVRSSQVKRLNLFNKHISSDGTEVDLIEEPIASQTFIRFCRQERKLHELDENSIFK